MIITISSKITSITSVVQTMFTYCNYYVSTIIKISIIFICQICYDIYKWKNLKQCSKTTVYRFKIHLSYIQLNSFNRFYLSDDWCRVGHFLFLLMDYYIWFCSIISFLPVCMLGCWLYIAFMEILWKIQFLLLWKSCVGLLLVNSVQRNGRIFRE